MGVEEWKGVGWGSEEEYGRGKKGGTFTRGRVPGPRLSTKLHSLFHKPDLVPLAFPHSQTR